MKKILITAFIVLFTLLFLSSCWLGNAALTLFSEMNDMTHFDMHDSPSVYEGEAPKFYSETGCCYKAVDIPDGITRDVLTEGLSMKDHDGIVTTESGLKYILYHDPLETGEKYVLLVPTFGSLDSIARPLGYYAVEVNENEKN